VTAGYPGAVAPLGTALTEDQLALLWKMTDEPVLCFDGDPAGRRAAYRVIDIALERLSPGKSLRFAVLPPGQDPDDLARSGGAEALAEVLASARPLSDMLWGRETEAGSFDTPERRAALEARLATTLQSIGDETVRKYYRDDLAGRIRALFGRPADSAGRRGRSGRQSPRSWAAYSGSASAPAARRTDRGSRIPWGSLAPASSGLTASPIVRGSRSAMPAREALILVAVLHHPWLLESHAEQLAELEFRHPDAGRLRRAVLDAAAGHPQAPLEPALLREAVTAAGFGPLLARVQAAITHPSDWPARPDAAPDDVTHWWNHVVTLHRKQRTLNRELKDAERALGNEPSEENLHWLKDVQARLSALEGTEALIEDFGVSSGRPARTF
jgi:DNA primase